MTFTIGFGASGMTFTIGFGASGMTFTIGFGASGMTFTIGFGTSGMTITIGFGASGMTFKHLPGCTDRLMFQISATDTSANFVFTDHHSCAGLAW
jgi:hypothetical protein